jgi:hypothetical protein
MNLDKVTMNQSRAPAIPPNNGGTQKASKLGPQPNLAQGLFWRGKAKVHVHIVGASSQSPDLNLQMLLVSEQFVCYHRPRKLLSASTKYLPLPNAATTVVHCYSSGGLANLARRAEYLLLWVGSIPESKGLDN